MNTNVLLVVTSCYNRIGMAPAGCLHLRPAIKRLARSLIARRRTVDSHGFMLGPSDGPCPYSLGSRRRREYSFAKRRNEITQHPLEGACGVDSFWGVRPDNRLVHR